MSETLDKLSRLIIESGLSQVEFSRVVLGRDARSLRRWLAESAPIPETAAAWISRIEAIDVSAGVVAVRVRR